jgi:formyl-CoA transferase
MTMAGNSALSGLKVVEFAQLIAGPMAGSLLGDLGAEVVHIEDPGSGDPLRKVRADKEDRHLWWKVSGRNKRSATLNLRSARGQDVARSLVRWADVVITNMRPSTLESWGLDWSSAVSENPTLIMLHITGFGLNTSMSNAPGFGKVGEAMSGVVHVTGFPDGPPVHTGFSHADSLAGLMGALGVEAALYRKSVDPEFSGELVDLALFEPLFRLIEWQLVEQDQLGKTPMRAGNQLEGSVGSVVNLFRSSDDEWVTVSAGTPRSVRTLADFLGVEYPENADSDELAAVGRQLDGMISDWISTRPGDVALAELRNLGIVVSKIFNAADILDDVTYRERGDVVEVPDDDLGSIRMQAVVPKMLNHAGEIRRTGPALGEDNDLVYQEYLGIPKDEYLELQAEGVI